MHVLAGLVFGIVAGLRVFTGEAVFFGLYGSGVLRLIFPIFAVGEYVVDAHPKARPRTAPEGVVFRFASAAFMGWTAGRVPGIVAAIIGAYIGTFGGLRARLWLIRTIGAVPAALLEDAVAIGLAFAATAAALTS